jgi:hypothetical protein
MKKSFLHAYSLSLYIYIEHLEKLKSLKNKVIDLTKSNFLIYFKKKNPITRP